MTRQSLRCGDFLNAVQEYAEIVLAQAVTALILTRRCPGQRAAKILDFLAKDI